MVFKMILIYIIASNGVIKEPTMHMHERMQDHKVILSE